MTIRGSTLGAACAAVLVLAGCATTSEDDPVQTKLAELDARVTRIERVVSNNSLLELSNEMEALRADVPRKRNLGCGYLRQCREGHQESEY